MQVWMCSVTHHTLVGPAWCLLHHGGASSGGIFFFWRAALTPIVPPHVESCSIYRYSLLSVWWVCVQSYSPVCASMAVIDTARWWNRIMEATVGGRTGGWWVSVTCGEFLKAGAWSGHRAWSYLVCGSAAPFVLTGKGVHSFLSGRGKGDRQDCNKCPGITVFTTKGKELIHTHSPIGCWCYSWQPNLRRIKPE